MMSKPVTWIGIVGAFVLVLTAPAESRAGDLVPQRLRCEYAENPLAVEAGRPRLS